MLQNVFEGDVLDAKALKTFLSRGTDVIIWGVSGFQVGVRLGEEQKWTPESAIMNDPYFCEESAKRLCEVLRTANSDGNALRPRLIAMGTIGINANYNHLGADSVNGFKPYAWFKGLKDGSAHEPRSAYDDKYAMERVFKSNERLFRAPVVLRPAFLVDDPPDKSESIVGQAWNYLLNLTVSREKVGRWLYDSGIKNPLPSTGHVQIKTISKGV